MRNDENIIKIASTDSELVASGLADDVIDFVTAIREDFEVEVHYLHGPSFLIEMTFQENVSRLAVLIKLVFGSVEVELS